MRACRRFLAGIPHFRPGHPCVTHPSATPSLSLRKERRRTFDLHVLGTPPAFILSQDQTRHPMLYSNPSSGIRLSAWDQLRSRPSCCCIACSSVHLHLAVRRLFALAPQVLPDQKSPQNKPQSFLTGTASRRFTSRSSCCFCFPLFSCQGTCQMNGHFVHFGQHGHYCISQALCQAFVLQLLLFAKHCSVATPDRKTHPKSCQL